MSSIAYRSTGPEDVRTVGIRALKQNASEVVARAAAGETIQITDRGRPVAQLTPLLQDHLESLTAAGRITLPTGALADFFAAKELLDEADRKRRRGLLFWLLPVAGLLILGMAFYGYFTWTNKPKVAEISIENAEKTINAETKIDESIKNAEQKPTPEKLQPSADLAISKEEKAGRSIGQKPANSAEGLEQITPNMLSDFSKNNQFFAKNATSEASKWQHSKKLDDQLPNTSIEADLSVGKTAISDDNLVEKITLNNQIEGNVNDLTSVEKFGQLSILQTEIRGISLVYLRKLNKYPQFSDKKSESIVVVSNKNRLKYGAQFGGFSSSKDDFSKRIFGGRTGILLEKKLNPHFFGLFSLDYVQIKGLKQSFQADFPLDTVKQYRFGLETVSGEIVPIAFHCLEPGIALKYKVYGKQFIEVGLSERWIYGAIVEMNKTTFGVFGDNSNKVIQGYNNQAFGWNKWTSQCRLGWSTVLNQHIQLAVSSNFQLKKLAKASGDNPGRYLAQTWLDCRIRYVFN